MKNSAIFAIVASAAVATAQVTIDNGTYTCSKPNVAFCAGDSLKTDIIIRCDSTGRGQPGRCSDNLAGEPPVGVQPALCYQSDPTVGDAACEKNCVVYGGFSNANDAFTLPADQCTPTFTATSSSGGAATETTTNTATQCGACESSSTSASTPESETSTTETVTEDTTVCPSSTGVPTAPGSVETTTAPTTGPVYPTGNGTVVTTVPSTLTTATPVAPTTTGPTVITTAGAAANAAGGLLAGFGLVVAYLL